MNRLGIIGTNWITDQFIEAALETKEYDLVSVYSRTVGKARAFGEKYGRELSYMDDLQEFFKQENLDVVYIASPNSLHFEQAKQTILHGKNVIVEKPAFSTPEEMDEIIQLANKQEVFFFEAARNIHEKSFQAIQEALPTPDKIQGASLFFAKYSSRYDEVLAGGEPNIFSLKFSGGALMDLGVYTIYVALGWFGLPKSATYTATKLPTGVDGMGTGILHYDEFDVTIQVGKMIDNYAPSQIFIDGGTLLIDQISAINEVTFVARNKEAKRFEIEAKKNPMVDEVLAFAEVMNHPTDEELGEAYEEWVELARNVNKVLYSMRQSAGIHFPADKK
ncbi:MAG: Gfo/Idh/MocA family oxidoreductase [Lactobacillales bacterium]|jgi:predicted dehydrogenase|nr:Gfo/Idh/MocA family oxidoreductase [Lactobacillales bacterium]